MKKITHTVVSLLLLGPTFASANDISFSIGGGYPYFVIPEVSVASADLSQRWYGNYKIGLDDGFSAGFEQAISDNNKHAIGLLVGALGNREVDTQCDESQNSDELTVAFANTIGCALAEAFDEETTNGIGLSYSYIFSGLNQDGWRLRFELGYGEASSDDDKRVDGGINLSYEF